MLLVFLHIPKAAGSSVTRVLEAEFGKAAIWRTRRPGELPVTGAMAFIRQGAARQAEYACLTGHMPLFILEHIKVPFQAFTFLRDPLERARSVYYHTMRSADDPIADRKSVV